MHLHPHKQQQQQEVRQRHSFTSLDIGPQNSHKYTNLGYTVDQPLQFTDIQGTEEDELEGIVLPGESLNGSNPTSPRSDEAPVSARSQTSQSSGSGDQSSPRSFEPYDLEGETSPRSFVSDDSENDIHLNSNEGDIHF